MPRPHTLGEPRGPWDNAAMDDYRRRFLTLALRAEALRFGDFTLKSGRQSPYFFNAGRFDSGATLSGLADCYADALDAHSADFDVLFGPAYKGIPLATALACAYARRGRDLPLAFNRKEAKAHGEGGTLIGAPLAGRRVLIVDDVITAGTAIREALALIREGGGTPVASAWSPTAAAMAAATADSPPIHNGFPGTCRTGAANHDHDTHHRHLPAVGL